MDEERPTSGIVVGVADGENVSKDGGQGAESAEYAPPSTDKLEEIDAKLSAIMRAMGVSE